MNTFFCLYTEALTCPPPDKGAPLDSTLYIMLQECVHSGGISCIWCFLGIYWQGSMDLHVYYSCLESCMVHLGPLLQYYYKQCFLSQKMSYEIGLNVLL